MRRSPDRSAGAYRLGWARVVAAIATALVFTGILMRPGAAAPSLEELRAASITLADLPPGFNTLTQPGFRAPALPGTIANTVYHEATFIRDMTSPVVSGTVQDTVSVMLVDAGSGDAAKQALETFVDYRLAPVTVTIIIFIGSLMSPIPEPARYTPQPAPVIGEQAERFTVQRGRQTADVITWRHRDVLAAVVTVKLTPEGLTDQAYAVNIAERQQAKLEAAFTPTPTPTPSVVATATPTPTGTATATPTAVPSVASPALTVLTRATAAHGTILTDADGRSLYVSDLDTDGRSICSDECARTWIPLLLESGEPVAPQGLSGTLSVAVREDGGRQVALDNRPLYRFSGDAEAGDVNGEGVDGVWRVVVLTPPP